LSTKYAQTKTKRKAIQSTQSTASELEEILKRRSKHKQSIDCLIMVKKSAIAMMLFAGSAFAQANAQRDLLWTPGDGLKGLAGAQNALGEFQEGAGILTANPNLWKDGVANQIGSGFTDAAGNYIQAVAGKRRALASDLSDDFKNLGDAIKTTGKETIKDLKNAGEQVGQDFKNAFNGTTSDDTTSDDINSNRKLLWTPGEGLMDLAAGQNALGEWQEGAGILTANPDLWKLGVANQVGSGFAEAAGNYIHAVAGKRRALESTGGDQISEDFENLGHDLGEFGKELGENLKDAGEQVGESFRDGWDTVSQDFQNAFDSSNRGLLWTPGEGLWDLAAGQNALGEFQEGAGILTANPELWKDGVANQIGSGFADAAGNWVHAVAGRRLFSISDAVDSIVSALER